MARIIDADVIGMKAGGDLRTKQWTAVKRDATGQAIAITAGATDLPVGILENLPNTGEQAMVRIRGIGKIKSAAALTPPSAIVADNSGKASAVTIDTTAPATTVPALGYLHNVTGGADELAEIQLCIGAFFPV